MIRIGKLGPQGDHPAAWVHRDVGEQQFTGLRVGCSSSSNNVTFASPGATVLSVPFSNSRWSRRSSVLDSVKSQLNPGPVA